MMHEKSRASLITADTAVFTMAADISWVRCCRRLRMTSKVTGSSALRMSDLDHQAAVPVHAGPAASRPADGGVAAIDQRGPDERHPGSEERAVVDRDRRLFVTTAREPGPARAAPRRGRIWRSERRREGCRPWHVTKADHATVDQLDAGRP